MIKIYKFNELEKKFYAGHYLDTVKLINSNISYEKADVYQLELLGVCYLKLKLTKNSIIVFEHIKKKFSNYHQVDINYALALKIDGQIKKAIFVCKTALKRKPSDYNIINILASAYNELNKNKIAERYYLNSINLNKKFTLAYINLSKLYIKLKKNNKASQTLMNAIKFCDDKDNLRDILAKHYIDNCNDKIKGERIYKSLIKNKTKNYHVYHNYGYYLQDNNNQISYVIRLLNHAIKLKKKFFECYNTLGIIYYKKGFLKTSIQYFKKSLSINKDFVLAKHNLGVAYIRSFKKLDIAWSLRESRRLDEFMLYKNFFKTIWNGKKIPSLYVWNEQGVGDEILFLNTAYQLSNFADRVTIHVNHRITKFYNNFLKRNNIQNIIIKPMIKNKIYSKILQIKRHDFHISLASLPKFFLTTKESFNNIKFPYIINNRSKFKIFDNNIKIGLSWKTTNLREQHRNLDLQKIKQLLMNKNYTFYNLQFGNIANEINFFKKNKINFKINKKIDYKNNFDYVTDLINQMDLILTVQNTVAHLCGSMNKKFIVTLSKHCRLNWGGGKESTPWYPSAIIVRDIEKYTSGNFLSKKIEQHIKKTLNFR